MVSRYGQMEMDGNQSSSMEDGTTETSKSPPLWGCGVQFKYNGNYNTLSNRVDKLHGRGG